MTEKEWLTEELAKAFYISRVGSVALSFKRAREENTDLAQEALAHADHDLFLIKEAFKRKTGTARF